MTSYLALIKLCRFVYSETKKTIFLVDVAIEEKKKTEFERERKRGRYEIVKKNCEIWCDKND